MKLISMTDFVLSKRMTHEEFERESFFNIQTHIHTYYDEVFAYATFLNKPLELNMFVPCDENGNVLIEPIYDPANEQYWAGERFMYDSAKERVLFQNIDVKIKKGENKIYVNNIPIIISDLKIFDIEDIVHHGFEFNESVMNAIIKK